jgi:DUF1680 family protein
VQGRPVIPTSGTAVAGYFPSPHFRLTPLTAAEFTLTEGFWARRQLVNRMVSEPSGYQSLQRAGTLANFELVAAGGAADQHQGEYFVDSDAYKWLEAVGWELGRSRQDGHAEVLRSLADQVIDLVRAAQAPDGYLDTWFQVKAPGARFTDLAAAHELYCAGHLFEAAVAWERAGDGRLLEVATRFADHIGTIFGPGLRIGVPGHPEIELALVPPPATTPGTLPYHDTQPEPRHTHTTIRLIPYLAWGNRIPGQTMRTWIPADLGEAAVEEP